MDGLRRTVLFVCVAGMIASLLVAVYPLIDSSVKDSRISESVKAEMDIQSSVPESQSNEGLRRASDYNERLLRGETDRREYESLLNEGGDGVMGVLEIPSIDTVLPIRHYSGEESLSLGAGHVYGTSLPVPCGQSHSVLSAHSSQGSQRLFSDLDKLVVGDRFSVYLLGERMDYEVDKVSIVEPDDISETAVEPGKDYVTLLTCTPKGINSHRLLVRGRLTEEPSEV